MTSSMCRSLWMCSSSGMSATKSEYGSTRAPRLTGADLADTGLRERIVVWSGYQDYFFSLYDKALSPSKTKKIVPDVVADIEKFLAKLLTPVVYTPPIFPSLVMPPASTVMVVNLPPLGCIPAMLTLDGVPNEDYDDHGCLKKLNITRSHNTLLGEKVSALRTKYPEVTVVYADAESVYFDILKSPRPTT